MILVTLCLTAALVPWLLLLLRQFSGSVQSLPSLLFFYEEQGGRLSNWKRYLIYLLQSLVFLLLAGYFYAGMRFAASRFFCVIDDHLRSKITPQEWQRWQTGYREICTHRFYSAAALAENRLVDMVRADIRLKGNAPAAAVSYLEWLTRTEADALLFFTREDNYVSIADSDRGDVFYYAEPLPTTKNFSFRKISLYYDPLDYRKRYLRIHTQPGAGILLERLHTRQSAKSDERGFSEIQLPMPEKAGLEILRLTLQHDRQAEDNLALVALLWYDTVSLVGNNLPQSIAALRNITEFPYYPLRKGHRFLEVVTEKCSGAALGFLEHDHEVFSRLPVYHSCSSQSGAEAIVLRFRDGRPAVTSGSGKARFWFDPDQVPDELLRHPAYALLLAETLYRAAAPAQVREAFADSATDEFPLVRVGQRQIREPTLLPIDSALAVNYHPDSAWVTGQNIPTHKIIPAKQKSAPVDPIWLAGALLVLGVTFVLQFPLALGKDV